MQWFCPLSKANACSDFHAISPDGGLKHVKGALLVELQKQGWHQVTNPKRSYYFEYDKTHPSYKEREKIGMEDNSDLLEVDTI